MKLREKVLDLVFPPKCPFCQRILEEPGASVCPACVPRLPWLEDEAGERSVEFADGCFSPLAYRDAVPEAMHRYKFGRVRALGRPFAELMARCLEGRLEERADLICWAPLSRKRLRERGFDQAELLAREVGRRLSVPVRPALWKPRHTAPQSGLEDASARRASVQGAYALLPGADLSGKRVVLVDDVVTSGSTLSACAALLRQGGAERVYCLTLAQARREQARQGLPEKAKNDEKNG